MWRLAQWGRPPAAANTASMPAKASRQGILAYWWNEMETHGPAFMGESQMSSPATARYSKGKMIGQRRARTSAMPARRASAPAAAGISCSISSNRVARSEGNILWAGAARVAGLIAEVRKRWSAGARPGKVAARSLAICSAADSSHAEGGPSSPLSTGSRVLRSTVSA